MLKFAYYPVFIFGVYNIIYGRKATLAYSLLVKSNIWGKTEELICKIAYAQLIATATNLKEIN